MQQKCIGVAVIDDHRMFAEALAVRLSDEPDLEVVGTAGSSTEALELFLHTEIHVVTLDVALAGEDGLALGRQLLDRWPDLGIVVVTGGADDRVSEAVQMGVRGWVFKQGAIETLLIAVRGAARGETHIPAAMLARVLVALSQRGKSSTPAAEGIALLTARELDVLRCLIDGLSRTEIGEMLYVSLSTVRTHIQRILHKLNVHSALTAVAFARRAGVIGIGADKVIAPKVAFQGLGMAQLEVVPPVVELQRRPDDHQATFTVSS
jgi:DNA-binding NarL/FixJ family response regulator